jgi:hypothetical protein
MIPLLAATALPAAAQATTEELLAGMVTEEVEPGVFPVVDDGVRDLSGLGTFGGDSVPIAPDGVVWVCSERTGRLFRLGGAEAQTVGCPFASMIIAADGRLWLSDHDTDSIRSFDPYAHPVQSQCPDRPVCARERTTCR